MSISLATVVAEIDNRLRTPGHDPEGYFDSLLEKLLPPGVPMLRRALSNDSEHPAVRANLAAIELIQRALMGVCRHICAGYTVDEAATNLGYTDFVGTEDAVGLLKELFRDYELILFGRPTS